MTTPAAPQVGVRSLPAARRGTCPLCDVDVSNARRSIAGRVQCICGMVYQPVLLPDLSLGDYWDCYEYSDSSRLERYYTDECRQKAFRALVQSVRRWTPGRTWFDAGCGPGQLLMEAASLGWEARGMDVSERAVALARGKGLEVSCGVFPDDMPGRAFDVVSMVLTLEYLADPRLALRTCRARLRPAGVLVLQVKNLSFWRHGERFARARSGIWSPLDLQNYSPATISLLLTKCGFDVVEIAPARIPWSPAASAWLTLVSRATGAVLAPNLWVVARPSAGGGSGLESDPEGPSP
jgi:SAM-dependent methyltransferase